jgi:GT2 family glycosyltransferase
MTCHNRKDKTLSCLKSLFEALIPNGIEKIDVFLVDDGSSDDTSKCVNKMFPSVNIIRGNGEMYWNGGMRLAWESAGKNEEYDFYFWLNDDVLLNRNALSNLFDCYRDGLRVNKKESIVTGAFFNSLKDNQFSYGGRTDSGVVLPNGKLQTCKYINGNAVLVPRGIYNKIGNLSGNYTHAMGDFDYGLRSIESGFSNYTTKSYIGVCPINGLPQWSNPEISIRERIENFYSPTGLNFKEYIVFRRRFWKVKWLMFAVSAYLRVLFPKLYLKMKGNSL